jgi:hypothetical protein
MKITSLFTVLFCLTIAFSGCATHKSPLSVGGKAESGVREGLNFPVTTQTSLLIGRQFPWWPTGDFGYDLPAGTYKAECEDDQGVFFKAPSGLSLESVEGKESVKGGIYLPKMGTTGVRGHVYLWQPGWLGGWKSFMLPDEFFSSYGNIWVLLGPDGKRLPPPHPMPGTQ